MEPGIYHAFKKNSNIKVFTFNVLADKTIIGQSTRRRYFLEYVGLSRNESIFWYQQEVNACDILCCFEPLHTSFLNFYFIKHDDGNWTLDIDQKVSLELRLIAV